MQVIERAVMPDGTEIQLEDWSEHNSEDYPNLYGLQIGAYPIAKNTGKYRWVEGVQTFRLTISSGEKKLEDLTSHFWNGEKDMWYLGMDVVYQGW